MTLREECIELVNTKGKEYIEEQKRKRVQYLEATYTVICDMLRESASTGKKSVTCYFPPDLHRHEMDELVERLRAEDLDATSPKVEVGKNMFSTTVSWDQKDPDET